MIAASWSAVSVHRWSWRRPAVALGASLLAHYVLVGGWPASGGGRPAISALPQLQAQLEISPASETVPVLESAERPRGTEPDKWSRPVAVPPNRAGRQTAIAAAEVQPSAHSGQNIPDARFLSARELDRYPAPVAPLDLRGPGKRAGIVRVWVSIDIAGNVVDVAMVDSDPSGVLQRQVREQLLAVQFMPGMKDGRPVRSRVLLELEY